MPDTDTDVADDTEAAPAPRRSARDVILAAQAKIAAAHNTDGHLPDASAKAAVNLLGWYKAPEEMRDDRLDVKAVLVDLLDWDEKRVTKAVTKAAAAAMMTEGKFPQAIEVLSFAAAASALLDSDRLAKLIREGTNVDVAYAPITTVSGLAAQLHEVLDRYQPAKRLSLLESLWAQSHDGQWWMHTAGKPKTTATTRRRGRRLDADERDELTERLTDAASFDPDDVITALRSRLLTYSPVTVRKMAATKFGARHLADLARIGRDANADLDGRILIARVPTLTPAQRPPSPIPDMTDALVRAWAEDEHPDGLEQYQARPNEWSDLYPQASTRRYPYPNAIWKLNGLELADNWVLTVIPSDAHLSANGDEMGNCTAGYANRCQTGLHAITRLVHAVTGEVCNGSFTKVGNDWRVGEINSRFNRGDVPNELRAAFTEMVAQLRA